MEDPHATTPQPFDQSLPQGLAVYDISGAKVGTVSDYRPDEGYLQIKRWFFMRTDLRVPRSAIAARDRDAVYLKYTLTEIEGRDWAAEAKSQPMTISAALAAGEKPEAYPIVGTGPLSNQNPEHFSTKAVDMPQEPHPTVANPVPPELNPPQTEAGA